MRKASGNLDPATLSVICRRKFSSAELLGIDYRQNPECPTLLMEKGKGTGGDLDTVKGPRPLPVRRVKTEGAEGREV